MAKLIYTQRSAARFWVVLALYQMDMTDNVLDKIIQEFRQYRINLPLDNIECLEADADYFELILRGCCEHSLLIDEAISSVLPNDWKLSRLDSTLRAILRAGVFEIIHCSNIPSNVILSEYTDMSYAYFGKPESGMANATLDKLVQEKRP